MLAGRLLGAGRKEGCAPRQLCTQHSSLPTTTSPLSYCGTALHHKPPCGDPACLHAFITPFPHTHPRAHTCRLSPQTPTLLGMGDFFVHHGVAAGDTVRLSRDPLTACLTAGVVVAQCGGQRSGSGGDGSGLLGGRQLWADHRPRASAGKAAAAAAAATAHAECLLLTAAIAGRQLKQLPVALRGGWCVGGGEAAAGWQHPAAVSNEKAGEQPACDSPGMATPHPTAGAGQPQALHPTLLTRGRSRQLQQQRCEGAAGAAAVTGGAAGEGSNEVRCEWRG